MDESRWNEVLDPPAARLLSCPSANWIHIIIFSSNYSEEGFPGHNSLDICIWVQFFGYFYLAIFAGHISLDICIWVFLWVTNLWIFVFGYFCESYFLGICDLVFLRVIFIKAVQWASSSPRCHFQQVGKHL